MNKKVYILMATYNGEKYIKEQIESILNQTYQNWKLIIHDDNSKDNTLNIIKEYIKKHPEKIILIDDNISTGGAKENFAYLLNKIDDNFDYIMFSDQDDIWLENKIEITLNKMIEVEKNYSNKPLLVHTDLKVVDKNLNILNESFWNYQKINPFDNSLNCLMLENTVTGCTMMINKNLYNFSKNIPKEAIMHDWWIALVCRVLNGEIVPIETATILYRQHSSNNTGAINYNLISLFFKYIRNPLVYIKKIIFNKKIKQQQLIVLNKKYYTDLVSQFLEQKSFIYRKIFILRNNLACGYWFKKIIKFIFN